MIRKWGLMCALVAALGTSAHGADAPGVTPTEIKIGGIFPFSGPASSIGLVGRGILAYVHLKTYEARRGKQRTNLSHLMSVSK